MAKAKKLSGGVIFFLVIVFSVIGFAAGFWGYGFYGSKTPLKGDVLSFGGLSIHFPELGNYKTGDCTLIKKGQTEVLIDAGASTSNIDTIDNYIKQYCEDGKLEYVIVTHAHEDHYAGFTTENSLFNRYEIGVIIEFAQVEAGKTEKAMYKKYVRERDEAVAAGAKCYTAKECRESGNYKFDLGGSAILTILDSYYYYNVSNTENDHSVCTLLTQGDYNFLFTGDLEKKGEEKLVEMNELPQVNLFKAGHHGSFTSSNDVLLSVIKPEIVCVCCCAGTSEYTDNNDKQFPSTDFINRIAPYTDKVYVTTVVDVDAEKTYKSMNGNIVATLGKKGITVKCSNNDILLKDTEWFKANRVCPDAWKAA